MWQFCQSLVKAYWLYDMYSMEIVDLLRKPPPFRGTDFYHSHCRCHSFIRSQLRAVSICSVPVLLASFERKPMGHGERLEVFYTQNCGVFVAGFRRRRGTSRRAPSGTTCRRRRWRKSGGGTWRFSATSTSSTRSVSTRSLTWRTPCRNTSRWLSLSLPNIQVTWTLFHLASYYNRGGLQTYSWFFVFVLVWQSHGQPVGVLLLPSAEEAAQAYNPGRDDGWPQFHGVSVNFCAWSDP